LHTGNILVFCGKKFSANFAEIYIFVSPQVWTCQLFCPFASLFYLPSKADVKFLGFF
jgi:hypothetical protein